MAKLVRAAVLGCPEQTIGGTRLLERADLALVSLAIPQGQEAKARLAISAAFGLESPDPGGSVANRSYRLIWMASDQMMLAFRDESPVAEHDVRAKLNGACYTTNQTDGWVILSISGSGACRALSRLCPLDLHDSAFPVDSVARTMMEHMGAMVLRDGDDSFLLFSASSSAESFLETVEEAIRFTA